MLCDYIIRIQDIRIATLPEEWSLQIQCGKRVCILSVTKSNYKSCCDSFALTSRHARPTRLGGLCPRQRHPLGRVWNPHLLQPSSYETEEGTNPIHLLATIPFSDIWRYRTLFGTTVLRWNHLREMDHRFQRKFEWNRWSHPSHSSLPPFSRHAMVYQLHISIRNEKRECEWIHDVCKLFGFSLSIRQNSNDFQWDGPRPLCDWVLRLRFYVTSCFVVLNKPPSW